MATYNSVDSHPLADHHCRGPARYAETAAQKNCNDIIPNTPPGKLVKDVSHINVSFGRPKKDTVSIEIHHGDRAAIATLRTVRTLIENLITGVTRGFLYKMRYVYAHFPINVNIEHNKETDRYDIEIRYVAG